MFERNIEVQKYESTKRDLIAHVIKIGDVQEHYRSNAKSRLDSHIGWSFQFEVTDDKGEKLIVEANSFSPYPTKDDAVRKIRKAQLTNKKVICTIFNSGTVKSEIPKLVDCK